MKLPICLALKIPTRSVALSEPGKAYHRAIGGRLTELPQLIEAGRDQENHLDLRLHRSTVELFRST